MEIAKKIFLKISNFLKKRLEKAGEIFVNGFINHSLMDKWAKTSLNSVLLLEYKKFRKKLKNPKDNAWFYIFSYRYLSSKFTKKLDIIIKNILKIVIKMPIWTLDWVVSMQFQKIKQKKLNCKGLDHRMCLKLVLLGDKLNYLKIFLHSSLITLGLGFLLGISSIVNADDYRHKTTTEFNVNGTGYYGRLALTGDFNNDGIDEMLYLRLSPAYMDYQWSDKAKRRNVAYALKGISMAKANPDKWSSHFVTYTMLSSGKRGASWNVSWNGNDRLAPVGCIQPSQVVPTNFNKDNYIDFLIVCHGYDDKPWPGERSVVAISDGPNSYKVKHFGRVGFYHDGDVADFNGDGNMDILLLNQNKSKKAEVYLNDGNENFIYNDKHFSQFASFKGAYGAEVIDINSDGLFDVSLFGHENKESWNQIQTMILLNSGNNTFSKKNKLVVPPINGWGTVMDMFVEDDNLFVLRTSSPKRYRGNLIQQININTMKTVATLKNSNMNWYSRIFRKTGGKFGSLMNTSNDLDFKLVNGKIALAK